MGMVLGVSGLSRIEQAGKKIMSLEVRQNIELPLCSGYGWLGAFLGRDHRVAERVDSDTQDSEGPDSCTISCVGRERVETFA